MYIKWWNNYAVNDNYYNNYHDDNNYFNKANDHVWRQRWNNYFRSGFKNYLASKLTHDHILPTDKHQYRIWNAQNQRLQKTDFMFAVIPMTEVQCVHLTATWDMSWKDVISGINIVVVQLLENTLGYQKIQIANVSNELVIFPIWKLLKQSRGRATNRLWWMILANIP